MLGKLVFGGRAAAMYGKASIQSQPARLPRAGAALAVAAFSAITFLAVLPHLGVEMSTVERTDQGIRMVSRGTLPNGGGALPALLFPANLSI